MELLTFTDSENPAIIYSSYNYHILCLINFSRFPIKIMGQKLQLNLKSKKFQVDINAVGSWSSSHKIILWQEEMILS